MSKSPEYAIKKSITIHAKFNKKIILKIIMQTITGSSRSRTWKRNLIKISTLLRRSLSNTTPLTLLTTKFKISIISSTKKWIKTMTILLIFQLSHIKMYYFELELIIFFFIAICCQTKFITIFLCFYFLFII